tara:strand:- start:44 stop:292 length:249 start_codon:yes stop_codon:yes gene_type:complete
MAARGQAAKSVSGAAMSKYDVEVEARLRALEAKVAELSAKCDARAASAAPAAGGDSEKTELLWKIVNAMEPNFDHLVKRFGG